MKPIYKKLILWLLLLLHISLIFSFSFQNAEESSRLSREMTSRVKSQEQFIVSAEKEESNRPVEIRAKESFLKLEGIMRKLAHIALFFILGILINLLIESYVSGRIFTAAASLIFAAAVAFTDETIQLFSVGRAGLVSDVLIDLIGAVAASTFFIVWGKIYEKNKEKRVKMDS